MLVEPAALAPGALIEPDHEELKHLRARRAQPGDTVRLFDGDGGTGDGRLEALGRGMVIQVGVVDRAPPPARVALWVGAGDRERFGWLVEKAAELGVTELLPLETERAVSVATRLRETHLEALRRRARQAIKQSGAAWAPRVLAPMPLVAVLPPEQQPREGARWLADATGAAPPILPEGGAVTIVVGPEGGLTLEEIALLRDRGFEPVRLAAHALRFETAALAAAALVAAQRSRRHP